jgi:cytochrome c biogenesis protein CcmG/thiol:disulfide interchange protein DsbE
MEPPQAHEEQGSRGSISPAWLAAGAVTLLVLALLAYALVAKPSAVPKAGEPVPDFQMVALDGTKMDIAAQAGRVVVVNFFASWCEPCREEAAALEASWKGYQDSGVQFYGIAYKDVDSRAQKFLEEFGVTYPSAVDPANRTARAYGVTGVPETFIVDQQGRLHHHFLGAVTQAELSTVLDEVLNR